jgi:CRP-like cAMP-binding protein
MPSPRTDLRGLLEDRLAGEPCSTFRAGSAVPLLRNGVWLVVRGLVRLHTNADSGQEVLLGLAGAWELFGDPLTRLPASRATALWSSDLLALTLQQIHADPELCRAVLEGVMERQRQSESLLALVTLRRVEDRVRGFLELLAECYGQPCASGLQLDLQLTHRQIAAALGTTRVTVTRVIGNLREQGWLQIDGERCLVISHLPSPATAGTTSA